MGLDVLRIRDVESFVLSGVLMAFRCSAYQGVNQDYLAGVLAQAEHTCISSKGDWESVVRRAQSVLDGGQRRLLESVLTIGSGSQVGGYDV